MLNRSNVIFEPESHTYWLNGKQLKGITGLISKHLFPDKYKSVPAYILENARIKGDFVHSNCELADSLGITPEGCPEASLYINIKREYGLETIENEYIVSDGENFASPIDVVFKGNHLADIKTTYALDLDYVRWQLSIYAYFFELQNPGETVGDLLCIWLRPDKAEIHKIERYPVEIVRELLCCELSGEKYVLKKSEDSALCPLIDVQDILIEMEQNIKEITAKRAEILESLYKAMKDASVDKWETDRLKVTRKKPTSCEKFDSTAFKKSNPDLYNQYKKTSTVKGSVLITLKKI